VTCRRQLVEYALGPEDPVPRTLPPSLHRRVGEAATGPAAVSMSTLAQRQSLLALLPATLLSMLAATLRQEQAAQSMAGAGTLHTGSASTAAAPRLVKVCSCVRTIRWVAALSQRAGQTSHTYTGMHRVAKGWRNHRAARLDAALV
jgi:hypothetical protein